jgi:hypothetical protein
VHSVYFIDLVSNDVLYFEAVNGKTKTIKIELFRKEQISPTLHLKKPAA